MPQNFPTPVNTIVIKNISVDEGRTVHRLHIWTATRLAHAWIADNAPKIGSYQEASLERGRDGCGNNRYGMDYHVLHVSPVYDIQQVIDYLGTIQTE